MDTDDILSYACPTTYGSADGAAARTYEAYEGGGYGYDSPDSNSNTLLRAVVLAVIVLILIVLIYRLMANRNLPCRLARKGWTVYMLKGCHYCEKQKKNIGDFDRVVEYNSDGTLDCSYTDKPPVAYKDIHAFPTWYNTKSGVSHPGYQDEQALRDMAR